jgi:thioredoxin reductase (NADPH)
VGDGRAGLTGAAAAAKLGLKVATFEAEFFGGLVVNVNELQNFDEAEGLSGMDHAGMLAMGNKKAGVVSTTSAVTVIRRVEGGFEAVTDAGVKTARFVVIASGARLKKLGVPGEEEFEGRGVSHCADCDAPMFTGEEVVVAGGGDWALQDAMVLSPECAVVHVVQAEAALMACPDYVDRVKADPKVRFHAGLAIEEVLGNDKGMTGVRVRDPHGNTSEIAAAGLFAMIGLEPNSELAPAQVARDERGYLVTDKGLETAVPGLWAIGQVRSGFAGWLKDAVAEARAAAQAVKARAG